MRNNRKSFLPGLILLLTAGLLIIQPDLSGQQKGINKIQSAFDPVNGAWDIDWPGRISQYDLVCLSPPVDPLQGIPLGNGDIGVLFWCENSKIIAVVNKSDLWDDASFGPFRNWNGEEEDHSTTQRHACRIIIDFKFPVFNTLYLTDFKAKLNLADGSLSLNSESAFGKISLKAFVDHKSGLLVYDLGSDMKEDLPVEVSVERFGSRTFSHWYHQINRDASIGLSGTEAIADNDGVFITQQLTSGTFAAGGRVISDNGIKVDYQREHSRAALIRLSGIRGKQAELAFAVTSPVSGNAVSEAKKMIPETGKTGIAPLKKSNADAWRSIWERSFVDYGDAYLNNLWHLTIFYANASQGGKYPGRFNNGLWGWNSDVQNWNFYFHWNQQQLSWPLNAAGMHELVNPYLDFRFNSLPKAQKDARELFNARGAFVSDVTDRRGYNSSVENANHTPVAEIALDFWRQYQYTCDKKFLGEKALPFMLEAARYYESILEKEPDGLYHAKEGTGYEGWIELKDGLTELVYARVLFAAALEALKVAGKEVPDAAHWRDILAHLAPLPAIKAGSSSIARQGSGFMLTRGFKKGQSSPTDSILAAGWGIKENKYLTVYFPVDDTANYGLKLLDGIFPSVPSSPVFPSGLVGLNLKGSPTFNNAVATTLLYGREITGWDPVPIVMARLGMADDLASDLENFPGRWQIYCNGWGHWGLEREVNKDAEWFFRTNMVKDVADPEGKTFPLPMWPFRHMSMEAMSVFATAINESLLQSYEGTVRVFPAFPSGRSGRFTLHAEGGFIVSSEFASGEVQWISVRSLYGNILKVELPWEMSVKKTIGIAGSQKLKGKLVSVNTKPGEMMLLVKEGIDPDNWSIKEETPQANDNVRYHSSGKSRLGIPRMF